MDKIWKFVKKSINYFILSMDVLKYLVAKGNTYTDCLKELQLKLSYPGTCMGRTTAFDWFTKFYDIEQSITRKQGSGTPTL